MTTSSTRQYYTNRTEICHRVMVPELPSVGVGTLIGFYPQLRFPIFFPSPPMTFDPSSDFTSFLYVRVSRGGELRRVFSYPPPPPPLFFYLSFFISIVFFVHAIASLSMSETKETSLVTQLVFFIIPLRNCQNIRETNMFWILYSSKNSNTKTYLLTLKYIWLKLKIHKDYFVPPNVCGRSWIVSNSRNI